jgi:hypothetical protein
MDLFAFRLQFRRTKEPCIGVDVRWCPFRELKRFVWLTSWDRQISSLKEKIRALEEVQPLGAIVTPASSNADSSSGRDTIVEWRDIIDKRRFFWPEDPVHYVKNGQTSYFGNFSSERFISRVKSHWNRSTDKTSNSID